jgi:hypothetical protein
MFLATETDPGLVFIGILVGLTLSCVIADAAGAHEKAWGWGLLGPPGWVVAAVRGSHVRLDALREALTERPSTAVSVSSPAASETSAATATEPEIRIYGPPDGEGRVHVVCLCNQRQRLYYAPGRETKCIGCGRALQDVDSRRVSAATAPHADPSGSAWTNCGGCSFALLAIPSPGASTPCPECGAEISGFMLNRPK